MGHAVGFGKEQRAEAVGIHRAVRRSCHYRDEARWRCIPHHVGKCFVDRRSIRPPARDRAGRHESQTGQACHGVEISNTTPLPAKIYSNEGIAQVLFFQSDEPCERSYADKAGKYLKQRGVTLPKI